jgi:hypothetical protein
MERIVLRLLRASRTVAAVLSVASAWGCMPDPPAPLPPNGCVVACGTVSAGGSAGMGGAGGAVAGTGGSGGIGGAGGAVAGTGGGGQGGAPVSEPVPDFSLLDVNPASPTANQPVSPRDYLMRVSAWYFGHAT